MNETTRPAPRPRVVAAVPEPEPPEAGPGPAATATTLPRGAGAVAAALRTLPSGPGVYRMDGADGRALYVGKAKSLKKRVAAYARPQRLPIRLQRMIAQIASVEVITTHTEAEALLLESNLIKRLKPRYNVMLRDDKSFPYILLTGDGDWPQLLKHRGAQTRKGEYFGPFASAGAVNRTLAALQRAFPLRNCSDSVFASRTRPCLQYQIKRCTAPCVGRITAADYNAIVAEARDFLAGKSRDLKDRLATRMQEASDALDFETAAELRDRIRALAHIQSHQDINVAHLGDADAIALHQESGQVCVQVFFFRAGQNFGNRTYFPVHTAEVPAAQVLAAFIGQFYADKTPPPLVLTSHAPQREAVLAEALAVRAGRRIRLVCPQRGPKRKLVDHAIANAREALARRMAESATQRRLLEALADAFGLDGPPQRIEVYDNSHVQGANAVGAMVVAGPEGFQKTSYRKFNIRAADAAPGDDFAMMREVLTRRFRRVLAEDPDRDKGAWPDLVLIDGGRGHLNAALSTFADLGIDDVAVAAIAKGPDRDAGRERFHLPGRPSFMLKPGDPVLYFLQRLRDEAHRFAIGSHRARRARAIGASPLDEIPGIGAVRKKALLLHFGSARGVSEAGLADLEATPGISRAVARRIYHHFHPDG